MKVAVIGLGRMGAAMANKLIDAGHDVTVWNRTGETAASFVAEHGGQLAPTPADAAAGVDLAIAILASGAATKQVLLDPAFMGAVGSTTVVCDMGTSGQAIAKEIAERYQDSGARFVDAPVSGSVPSVLSGQLLVLGSGDEGDVQFASDILQAFAKRTIYLGPAGAGQTMKLCVNLIVHTLNAAVSESLALATQAGINPELAYEVFLNSSIAAPYVTYKKDSFLNPDAAVAMSLGLVAKDLTLISSLADEHGLNLTTLLAATEQANAAVDAGYVDADMAALVRYLQASER